MRRHEGVGCGAVALRGRLLRAAAEIGVSLQEAEVREDHSQQIYELLRSHAVLLLLLPIVSPEDGARDGRDTLLELSWERHLPRRTMHNGRSETCHNCSTPASTPEVFCLVATVGRRLSCGTRANLLAPDSNNVVKKTDASTCPVDYTLFRHHNDSKEGKEEQYYSPSSAWSL